jgi:DNA-3-methyladenine glycosylase
MHHCLNVVCGPDGEAAAVLIRAVEPVEGVERMRAARWPTRAAAGHDERLAAGPARTCHALGIDRTLGGIDLITDERLWLADDGYGVPVDVAAGPRIGVAYAGEEAAGRPWRFGIAGHPSLSRPFERGH